MIARIGIIGSNWLVASSTSKLNLRIGQLDSSIDRLGVRMDEFGLRTVGIDLRIDRLDVRIENIALRIGKPDLCTGDGRYRMYRKRKPHNQLY